MLAHPLKKTHVTAFKNKYGAGGKNKKNLLSPEIINYKEASSTNSRNILQSTNCKKMW